MGRLNPGQLREELRDALRGHGVGQLTDVVRLPSGFAILKVLPATPATADLNPERISSLVSTGAIRFGAQVSGLGEADAVLQDYPKPEGWGRDLRNLCEVRNESLAQGENQDSKWSGSGQTNRSRRRLHSRANSRAFRFGAALCIQR